MGISNYPIQESAQIEIEKHENAIRNITTACYICMHRKDNHIDAEMMDYYYVYRLLSKGVDKDAIMSMSTEEVKNAVIS